MNKTRENMHCPTRQSREITRVVKGLMCQLKRTIPWEDLADGFNRLSRFSQSTHPYPSRPFTHSSLPQTSSFLDVVFA